MKNPDDDFEILEPSEYTGKKNEVYSHSSLVMSALNRVKENRSKEMRDGYWNTKFDRLGNAHKVWMPDTREEFIESVEALMMIQERDYDEEAIKEIKKVKEALEDKFKIYCELEKKQWDSLPAQMKKDLNMKGKYYREGRLSDLFPYNFEYLRDKVDYYTRIVSIIQVLIKRIGEYQEEMYEA
ncbi:MAG: hypothetical protein PHC38_08635 [Weeksellaceae bacterium]|nr:hypothetical protein [Weeksellaceae bacterium]